MIGGGLALSGALLALIKFWLNAANDAAAALREAKQSRAHAEAAHEKVAMLAATVSAHREVDARELVSRTTLREVENRLVSAIERLDGAVERVGDRLDDILKELVANGIKGR